MARKILIALALSALSAGLFSSGTSARSLQRLIAPTSVCAHQTDQGVSVAEQEQAMRCMTNFARQRAGMARFGDAAALDRSADDKAGDILRCNSFSHDACGRQFTYWMARVGYLRARCWRAAENIAWGDGAYGDVRSIFGAWIHSPEHLANILGPYGQIGIAVDVGSLGSRGDVSVWTQHFGSHCGASRSHAVLRLAAAHRVG